ncbi:MAG: tryptophan permease [Alphaproteobacteria bacterium]
MSDNNNSLKSRSFIGGGMIVAGTAIGAGMFALPVVSAGMWSLWAVFMLIITWFFMNFSGLMILEANLNFPPGSSFDTIVKNTIGQKWNIINGIAITFLCYILTYAYISGGSSVVIQSFQATLGYTPPQKIAALVFALSLAFVVWLSTAAVDRLTTILIFGMVISFFMSVLGLTFHIKPEYLLDNNHAPNTRYFPFVFVALPVFLTSFGYQNSVPSLVKYYGKTPKTIARCIYFGTILALIFYSFWLLSILGNVPRSHFGEIIAKGGNMGALVDAVSSVTNAKLTSNLLAVFANMAVASSFLGVGLSLFDYLADMFKLDNSRLGRTKTAALVYIPPIIGGVFFPNGFIVAIGFAGLSSTIWAAIVPALMAQASRKQFGSPLYRAWGGSVLIYATIFFGILVAVCHILGMFNILPIFSG